MPSSPVDLLSQTALLDLETDKSRWESDFQDVRSNFEEELRLLDSQFCLTYSYEDMQRSWHGRDGQPMPLWTASVPAQVCY